MSCVPRYRVLQLVYTFMSGRILDACQIWEIMNYADILVKSQQWDHRWVAALLPSKNISVYNDSSLPTYVKVLADSLFISTLLCFHFSWCAVPAALLYLMGVSVMADDADTLHVRAYYQYFRGGINILFQISTLALFSYWTLNILNIVQIEMRNSFVF